MSQTAMSHGAPAHSHSKSGHHALRHRQLQPAHTEPAPQGHDFVQGQLVRALCVALAAVGFGSVRPSALEAFRAQTEEYMLHFLSNVQDSMAACRRTRPIPQDFVVGLARDDIAPSDLTPHLGLRLPLSITLPRILAPAPAETAPTELSSVLGGDLVLPISQTSYIPSHFPPLPSRHTWHSTPVYTTRETDPRKIRERATQEGILAEKALRRLATAANQSSSAAKNKRRAADESRERMWQETLADVLADCSDNMTGVTGQGGDAAGGLGMEVNHDREHWRRPAPYNPIPT